MSFRGLLRRVRARPKLSLVGLCTALVLLAGTVRSWATHLSSDVEGHTTVDQTICAQDPSSSNCLPTSARDNAAYYKLRTAPGEPYATRELSATPVAQPGRAQRRTSLLYFSQLTDFQLADEESPARVEFLDPTADQDPERVRRVGLASPGGSAPTHDRPDEPPGEPVRAGQPRRTGQRRARADAARDHDRRLGRQPAAKRGRLGRAPAGRRHARSEQRQQQPGRLCAVSAWHAGADGGIEVHGRAGLRRLRRGH